MLNQLLNWCKKNLLGLAVLLVAGVVVGVFVNIQVLHMTSEPEFCALCHPAEGYGPLAEVHSWEQSSHAEAGVSCLDCHGEPGFFGYFKAKLGGLKDTYMELTISKEHKLEILSNPDPDLVPATTCLFCHSDEANAKIRKEKGAFLELAHMRKLDSVENPAFRKKYGLPDIMTESNVNGFNFDHSLHVESMGLGCSQCHLGEVHREENKTAKMNACLACHEGSDAPQLADCSTCHTAQVAMNEGKGVDWVKGNANIMFAAGIGCDSCHTMVDDGHYRPTASSCVDCHDNDYVDVYKGWKSETTELAEKVQELKVEVKAILTDADRAHRNTASGWKLYKKALTAINFVKDDGTSGVHNNEYAVAVLQNAEKNLRQVMTDLNKTW